MKIGDIITGRQLSELGVGAVVLLVTAKREFFVTQDALVGVRNERFPIVNVPEYNFEIKYIPTK